MSVVSHKWQRVWRELYDALIDRRFSEAETLIDTEQFTATLSGVAPLDWWSFTTEITRRREPMGNAVITVEALNAASNGDTLFVHSRTSVTAGGKATTSVASVDIMVFGNNGKIVSLTVGEIRPHLP